ncbi:MAG TPA: hypothetical protein VM122_06045 [Usitatibacter sp.]|nr:hypothetical protein [Usitatibacter sp.]
MASAFLGAAQAGSASSSFRVIVNTDKSTGPVTPPNTGLCRRIDLPGAMGAIVTVVCSTGVVVEIGPGEASKPWGWIHGGAYRFLPPISSAGVNSASMDIDTGLGTVTSWRVVHLSDRDYLEMTVRW